MRQYAWDKNRARELLAEGKSDIDVADSVGCALTTLRSWKSREGLTKTRSGPSNKDQINALAKEARDKGLSYGELVAQKKESADVASSDAKKVSVSETPPDTGPIDLHFVLNDEEIYLRAGSTRRAQALLAYLSAVIRSEGAAVHAE